MKAFIFIFITILNIFKDINSYKLYYMLLYLLLLSFANFVFSYEPSCASCKHFIPHINNKPGLGLCKMFKNTPYQDTNIIIHDFAVHCRDNENLCGKAGFLYEPDEETIRKNYSDDYDELNNRCCGEVNEKNEIEELERDFFELFQKIRKHNTKRIYNSTKDLYKLFKKNK